MGKSRSHEVYKCLLGRLIEVWVDETGLPLEYGGELTLKREDVKRGVEGDECYWITHADQVQGRMEIDLFVDPPPDLVIESEFSTTVVNKLGIYAALRVPEIWRANAAGVRIGCLQSDGTYLWGDQGNVLPGFPVAEVTRLLQKLGTTGQMSIVREFRAWVRQQLGK
jgi:Uma2 family endonuclease